MSTTTHKQMQKKLKVMVVDDDRTTLEVTAALLEECGHEVIQRNSSLGTTAAIMRSQPDVVLLDVHMPGLSGDKLVELATPRAAGRRPFIVLYSGSAREELERLANRCGADASLEKTHDPAEFIKRFEHVMATLQRSVHTTRQRGG